MGQSVKFARFTADGRQLEFLSCRTTELDYVAISHVWGKCKWRPVKFLDHEILATKRKVEFIENQLFSLVGTQAFWFDTLTVNQRVAREVTVIKHVMPTIFRDAQRTLVVREGDGLYACCEEAVRGFNGYGEFMQLLDRHASKHIGDPMKESYLKRLWTLQECLVSHTLQFTVCGNGLRQSDEEDEDEDEEEDLEFDPLGHRTAMTLQEDALYSFAAAFFADEDPSNQVSNINKFMAAYLGNGIVRRSKRKPRLMNETIFDNEFTAFFSSSNRATATSRDYVFATMSQFPWYKYPSTAASMTWSEIFADLYEQATRSGNPFTARFTNSMLQSSPMAPQAWAPSHEQPEPQCLGDFLKLLGSKWEPISTDLGRGIHLCTKAGARSIDYNDSLPIQPILTLVENAMKHTPSAWAWSHKGGELPAKGGYPYAPDLTVKTLKLKLANALEKLDLNAVAELTEELSEAEKEQRLEEQEMLTDNWITTQCMRILSLWYVTMGITVEDAAAKSEWKGFLFEYSDSWHTPVRETLVLIAAIISCQVPLSALEWVRARFIPVRVRFDDRTEVLGLLAKHAAAKIQAQEDNDQTVIVAGRHTSDFKRGTELVLTGVTTGLPVGILPDFIHHFRQPQKEQWNRLKTLYGPRLVSQPSSPRQVYRHIALDIPVGPEADSSSGAWTRRYGQVKAHAHEIQKLQSPKTRDLYSYWTLQEKGWFRVLSIEPSLDPDERISCSLLHRPLTQSTRFEALSYTWGDEKAEHPILIDGNVFMVRRNLHNALRELRPISGRRTIWIDAICINQDDISERGSQVAQMGEVYSLAELVVVWLGESHAHSDLGFDALDEYFKVSNAVCKAAKPDSSSFESLAMGLPEFLALPNMDNCLYAISTIFVRPWWERMWTVQEVGLAREIEVQHGNRSTSWDHLHLFASSIMMHPVKEVLGRYSPESKFGRNALDSLLTYIATRARSMENMRETLKKGKLNLSLLARFTVQRDATDPRDKVYGFLGLTKDTLLRPNYALTVAEVYTAATKAMLMQNQDLRCLSFDTGGAADREPNLPSWALDFRNLGERQSLAMICGFIEDVRGRIYAAAPTGGPETKLTLKFEANDKILILKGVKLDAIRSVGDCAPFPSNEEEDSNLERFSAVISQWRSCVTVMDQLYIPGENCERAFWNTILLNRKVPGYTPGFFNTEDQSNDMRITRDDSWLPPWTSNEESSLVQALLSSSGQKPHLWGRKFAVSRGGYFSLLPGTAKEGDVLCILNGGEMPYVLRPLANGRYLMLGECYVHGMMDGEVAELVQKNKLNYQYFALE